MELVAKYLGIQLTRVEKEHQQPIVKAELIPPSPVDKKPPTRHMQRQSHSSAVCSLQ